MSAWPEDTRRIVRRFYTTYGYAPAWIERSALRAHARALLADLCRSSVDGLELAALRPPPLATALERFAEEPSDSTAASLDLQLTSAFVQFGNRLLTGRVDPETVTPEVYLKVSPVPVDSVLAELLARPAPESFVPVLKPTHPDYERLENALTRYREIADQGGWVRIAEGDLLKPGERDERVPGLRRRLAATGDLPEDDTSEDSLYDAKTQTALARFQRRHGLAADSVLGPTTLEALNVPAEDRVRQIELALEHWRWLPRRLGERYVIVNIPAFQVQAYDHGKPVLSMKTVVGAEMDSMRTPVFSDLMDYVVFRPYWNVPKTIVVREILPKARDDRSYLQDHGYEVIDEDGHVVDKDDVDLDKLESGTFGVRQVPGESNSLGLVKFVLPNRHNIYLHDTPADYLFEKEERDFSHGCIRLQDPVRFAEFVLGPQGWSRDEIESAMQGERKVVELETPLPVYIVYLSVFVTESGTISFRDDIYGFDEALDRELADHDRRELARVDTSGSSCERINHALDEL